jgi:MATE family multidrug resistance protein
MIRPWLMSVYSIMFLVFKNHWGKLFNDDPGMAFSFSPSLEMLKLGLEVIYLVASILPLVSLFQLTDGLAAVVSGVLRAQGRQATGALLNLVYVLTETPSKRLIPGLPRF